MKRNFKKDLASFIAGRLLNVESNSKEKKCHQFSFSKSLIYDFSRGGYIFYTEVKPGELQLFDYLTKDVIKIKKHSAKKLEVDGQVFAV